MKIKGLSIRFILSVLIILIMFSDWKLVGQNNYTEDSLNKPFYELSLDELMNVKVITASRINEKSREAPGIITIITSEEIRNNNCRDMVDVFNMVPGFTILTDLLEIQSLASRGLYAFEGRALIMVDGMKMNDNLFGTYPLGNDFPLAVIDRIEIVRGPGSVIYGGAAELAVINIITKQINEPFVLQGNMNTGVTFDQQPKLGHTDYTLFSGGKYKNINYSFYGYYGVSAKGTTSDRLDYLLQDSLFPPYELNYQTYGNKNLVFGSKVTAFERINFNFFYKHYENKSYIGGDFNETTNSWGAGWNRTELFENLNIALNTTFNLGNLKINPEFDFHYDLSWFLSDPKYFRLEEEAINVYRYKPALILEYNVKELLFKNDKLTFLIGNEFFTDIAKNKFLENENGEQLYSLKKPADSAWTNLISIWNYSHFSSLKYTLLNWNLVAGLRYDVNEITGSKFNPRVGLTYVNKKFHAKYLYSTAYRAPNIANVATNYSVANSEKFDQKIDRESTIIHEIEFGYQFTNYLFGSINLYSQCIEDIIEFNPEFDFLSTNAMRADGNVAKHGSEGIETTFHFIKRRYNFTANASYIIPGNNILLNSKNMDGKTYVAPLDGNNYYNGIPRFKFYSNHTYKLWRNYSLAAGLLYYSKRYAYRYNEQDEPYARNIEQQVVVNAGITKSDFLLNGLHLTFMIHDLFNEQLKYVSAFDSDWLYDSTPFSSVNARGRELTIHIKYYY